jgi:hypothetical protein
LGDTFWSFDPILKNQKSQKSDAIFACFFCSIRTYRAKFEGKLFTLENWKGFGALTMCKSATMLIFNFESDFVPKKLWVCPFFMHVSNFCLKIGDFEGFCNDNEVKYDVMVSG